MINDNGDNMIGVDWQGAVTSSVLREDIARLPVFDGAIGHAFLQRAANRRRLTRAGS